MIVNLNFDLMNIRMILEPCNINWIYAVTVYMYVYILHFIELTINPQAY